MIHTNPLGVLLGFTFITAVSLLFFWMFRVPPALPLPAVKVRRSLEAVHKILVPIVEAIPSERAVELAWRLGHDQHAEVILVHVIVVPFSMALNTPMPDREKIAQEAIKLGCIIAKRVGCQAQSRIIHHRKAADGILQVARAEQVDAIILGVGDKPRVPGEWGKTSLEILRRAPCEVIIDRVPIAELQMASAT